MDVMSIVLQIPRAMRLVTLFGYPSKAAKLRKSHRTCLRILHSVWNSAAREIYSHLPQQSRMNIECMESILARQMLLHLRG